MSDERPKIDHPYVFSASQVSTFRLCPRKWAFDKINGIRAESNKSAQLGTEVHDILEKYLKLGTPISGATEAGQIAISGTHNLPTPRSPGMSVEDWFQVVIGNAVFIGKKDFEFVRGVSKPFWKPEEVPFWKPESPLVGDHKTTSNFAWAKTEEDLLEDVQSGIYSYDAHKKSGAEEVNLFWNYYRTTGARASEPRRTVIKLPVIQNIVEGIAETSDQMIAIINSGNKAESVEQNLDACQAFGGCFYKKNDICKIAPSRIWRSFMTQENKTESMLEKLKRKKQEASIAQSRVEELSKEVSPPGEAALSKEVNPPGEAAPLEEDTVAVSTEAPPNTGIRKPRGRPPATASSATTTTTTEAPTHQTPVGEFGVIDAILDIFALKVAKKTVELLNRK